MNGHLLDEWLLEQRLPATYRDVIERVHLPLAQYLLASRRRRSDPLLVGISGCQGSGKSTLTHALAQILTSEGMPALALALDDFYLPRHERESLARRVHPLFMTRGVPGTHDVSLAAHVLDELASDRTVQSPRFDKSVDDRVSERSLEIGPAEVVLFEGWIVGATAQSPEDLMQPVNELERESDPDGIWRRAVNDALAGEYQRLFARLDELIYLRAPSFDVVLSWRAEQEDKLRARIQREDGDASNLLSAEQLRYFIAHYERLTRHMLVTLPPRSDVVISLDEQRTIVDVAFAHE